MWSPAFSCSRAAAVAGLALLAACSDRLPSGATGGPTPDDEATRTRIQCRVDVAGARLSCDAPAASGGASRSLMLGGQGTYLRLAGTGPSYDAGTGIFQIDVTVQNLTDQRLGTDDGTRTTGLRLFFNSGPTATGGTGAVTLANADGQALFLGSEQPFFSYPEILEPRGTSASRPWRFSVAPGVTSFAFTVYVEAQSPVEQGVLRWVRERGGSAGGSALRDVWATSPTRVFAVGDDGAVALFDGARWMGVPSPTRNDLMGVWGTSARNVYAVGDSGLVVRYDGTRWSTVRSGFPTEMLQEVWGSSATDLWVAGLRQSTDGNDTQSRLLLHYDGTSWTEVAAVSGGLGALYGVWGAAGQVFVAGEEWNAGTDSYDGFVQRFDGSTWSRVAGVPSGVLAGIWGSGAADVYVVGRQYNAGTSSYDGVILRFDGTSWTTTTSAGAGQSRTLVDVWGAPDGAVHIVGMQHVPESGNDATADAVLLRSAGAGWTETVREDDGAVESLWGTEAGEVFAVGSASGALRFDGTAWTRQMGAAADYELVLRGIWGSGGTVFAVGEREWSETSVIMQSTGGGWSSMAHPGVKRLSAVWGRSASQLFAVGRGVDAGPGADAPRVLRYNGSSWLTDAITITGVTNVTLTGVWGGPTGSVYAVGTGMNTTTFEPKGVLLSSAGTGTWSLVGGMPVAGRSFHGIWGTSASSFFVVGCNGSAATIVRFLGSWSETVVAGETRCLRAVWGTGTSDVWAAGDGGLLMHFDGTSWTTVASGTTATLRGIWGSASNEVYAAGDGGVLLRFNGTGWTQASSGSSAALQAIWGRATGDVYAVGAGMTVLHGTR